MRIGFQWQVALGVSAALLAGVLLQAVFGAVNELRQGLRVETSIRAFFTPLEHDGWTADLVPAEFAPPMSGAAPSDDATAALPGDSPGPELEITIQRWGAEALARRVVGREGQDLIVFAPGSLRSAFSFRRPPHGELTPPPSPRVQPVVCAALWKPDEAATRCGIDVAELQRKYGDRFAEGGILVADQGLTGVLAAVPAVSTTGERGLAIAASSLSFVAIGREAFRLIPWTQVAASLALAGLIGYLLGIRLLDPLSRLTHEVRLLSSTSNLRVTEPSGEIGDLASALNRTLAELESSRQIQRRFLRDTAHELKTPLSTLLGYAELSEQRPDQAGVYTGRIRRIAGRLRRLVEDLLALARGEALEAWENRAVDLARLAEEACTEQPRPVHVATAGEAWVLGDPARLRQALDNLVANALAATPEGGAVAVQVSRDGTAALLRVTDSGCGIPAETLERIWDPYFQVPGQPSGSGGTGLGLSIVQMIVRRHGGEVTVASRMGKGTEFTVRLAAIEVEGP